MSISQDEVIELRAMPFLDFFSIGAVFLLGGFFLGDSLDRYVDFVPVPMPGTIVTMVVGGIFALVGTIKYKTTFDPAQKCIHRKISLFVILPIYATQISFGKIRAIDLYHPQGGAIDEELNLYQLYYSGLFYIFSELWTRSTIATGSTSIRVQLSGAGDFLAGSALSDKTAADLGTALARMTGTRLT